jgi:uncharacterized protein involved in exopolysaccharide biosynthesis/Mrp family chromosome partitioning ATPase
MFTIGVDQNNAIPGTLRPAGTGHSAGDISSAALVGSVLSRKSWLLAGALTGALAGLLFSLTIPNQYRATAQMLIDPRDLRVLRDEVSPAGFNSDAATSYVESQARVISSDSIKRLIISSEGLDKDKEFGAEGKDNSPLERFRRDVMGQSGGQIDPVIAALLALDKKVTVRRGERTFVIDINVTSEDADKAARIANALAAAYLDDQGRVRADVARKATASLTSRLDELRQSVRVAEEKAQQFRARNNMVDAGGKVVTEEQLQQSASLLVTARARTAETKARLDQTRLIRISSVEAGAIPEAIASNTITALRAQLGAAQAREADLIANLGPQHPSLLAAQSQVRDARRQISDELSRIMQAAKSEYDRARSAEQAISGRFDGLKKDTLDTSAALVQLREIEREVEASRAVYQSFLLRARETGEQVGVNTTNARVISEATPPVYRSNIGRKVVVLAGLLAGFGLGAASAALRGLLPGRGPLTPSRGKAFSALVSGQKPNTAQEYSGGNTQQNPSRTRLNMQRASRTAQTGATAHHGSGKPGWRRANGTAPTRAKPTTLAELGESLGVVVLPALTRGGARRWQFGAVETRSVFQNSGFVTDAWDKPQSPFTGAVEQTLQSITASTSSHENLKILVLGAAPDSGASTLALNLALLAARESAIPLLIDAAGGPASLTQKTAPDTDLGLADVVNGSVGFVRAALQDDETGIFFLPRIADDDTAACAIMPAQLATGLFPFVKRFDPVVIDGGAVGGGLVAALAQGVDHILLVARPDNVPHLDLEAMKSALGSNLAKLRGVVPNHG